MELKDLESDSELMENYVWNKKKGVLRGKTGFAPLERVGTNGLMPVVPRGRLSPSSLR